MFEIIEYKKIEAHLIGETSALPIALDKPRGWRCKVIAERKHKAESGRIIETYIVTSDDVRPFPGGQCEILKKDFYRNDY